MAQKAIVGLNCPSCGGTLDIKEGRQTVECGFCGTGLMLEGESGLLRYYVKDEITRDQVKRATFKWLGTYEKAPDLQKTYKVEELFLIFVPFFRIRTQALGWILGKIEHEGDHGKKYFTSVERKVDKIYDWNAPACDVGEFGVDWINLEGDTLKPFIVDEVENRGMIFDPTLSFQDFEKKTMYKFEDWAREEAGLDLITFLKIHHLNTQQAVVYYPLWVFRYKYRNRTYQIVYDGEDGSMLYGTAPGNILYRVMMLTGSLFFTMFLFTSSLKAGNIPFAFLTFFMVLFAGYMGHKKFRYGSQVTYRVSPKEGEVNPNTTAKLKKRITVDSLIDMARKV